MIVNHQLSTWTVRSVTAVSHVFPLQSKDLINPLLWFMCRLICTTWCLSSLRCCTSVLTAEILKYALIWREYLPKVLSRVLILSFRSNMYSEWLCSFRWAAVCWAINMLCDSCRMPCVLPWNFMKMPWNILQCMCRSSSAMRTWLWRYRVRQTSCGQICGNS